MKKTYLVTVDLDPGSVLLHGEGAARIAIIDALNHNRFVYNPVVTLAPDSVQPINNENHKEGSTHA